MLRPLFIFCLSICLTSVVHAEAFDHSVWNKLVTDHVKNVQENQLNQITAVDYDTLAIEIPLLKEYLKQTSEVTRIQFDSWSQNEQLAFLINTYNAATVQLVLTGYPNIKSIRDLGSFFNSPFKKDFISLFGDNISLDDIEKGFVIGSDNYNDPRAHFALNCASISCPALRAEAYNGDRLEAQLNSQMTAFLSDRDRNKLDGKILKLSKIFDWYDDDFEAGWQNITSLEEFLVFNAAALGLTAEQFESLRNGKIKIRYFDYDWNLNKIK